MPPARLDGKYLLCMLSKIVSLPTKKFKLFKNIILQKPSHSQTLLQPRLVAGLPDLCERHCRMEPVENAQRQRDSLNDSPGQEPVELQLNRVCLDLLCLESIDNPHRDIADEQKGDHLSSGL